MTSTSFDAPTVVHTTPTWMKVTGWILTALPVLMLGGLGSVMLISPAPAKEAMAKQGWPEQTVMIVLGLEVLSALLYLIPRTAVLGAILVTGYLGGAVASHLRQGENAQALMPFFFGVITWLGLWFRDPRVRALAPFRKL